MWPFDRASARRKEIRRSRAERQPPWYRRMPIQARIGAVTTAVVTAAVASWIVSAGGELSSWQAGQTVARAVTSRIEFQIEDRARTAELRVRARDAAPNCYVLDSTALEAIRSRLANALTIARSCADDAEKLRQEAASHSILLDDAGLAELRRLAEADDASSYTRSVDAAITLLTAKPLVEPADERVRHTATEAILVDTAAGRERTVGMDKLVFVSNVEAAERAIAEAAVPFGEPLRTSMAASLLAMLRSESEPIRPLYLYDSARSVEAQERAAAAVPPQFIRKPRDAILADAGVITEPELVLLRAEAEQYRAMQRAAGVAAWRPVLGRSTLATVVILGLAFYLLRYQRGVIRHPLRHLSVAAMLLLILWLTRAMLLGEAAPPQAVVGSQALCTALLAIIYTGGPVYSVSTALAILNTLSAQEDIGFLLTLLAVSGTFAWGLRDVRSRGKVVLVGLIAGVAATVATVSVGLLAAQQIRFVLWQGAWAGGSALLAAFIVEGTLPLIERLFGLYTSMTLLEWCDANKPLLRLMAADAPGTYNHSLIVGTLAEAAAEAIGANGLLARCGAYYHDIGKINKPEYFVENQPPGSDRHARLSPAMSLLIIIGHVKDGIEMAREYGLPTVLHRFIAEHHGTTLVEYFYHAANRARKPGDQELSDSSFRYPGPRPQSRETAVVMLCDGVEGAVRAMTEPTPARIEDVVSEICRKRLLDGQLDECDLTFRELATIEKSLVKSLCGIYHARIVYPEAGEAEPDREARPAS
jgi:hypothetical protein